MNSVLTNALTLSGWVKADDEANLWTKMNAVFNIDLDKVTNTLNGTVIHFGDHGEDVRLRISLADRLAMFNTL
jgi:hypothetical protein